MKWEIRRIEPIRAANLVAVFYFITFTAFAVPMFWIAGSTEQQPAQKQFMQMFMLAYPFAGAIGGWIFTALGAVIYNALAPRMGGFLFDVGESASERSAF